MNDTFCMACGAMDNETQTQRTRRMHGGIEVDERSRQENEIQIQKMRSMGILDDSFFDIRYEVRRRGKGCLCQICMEQPEPRQFYHTQTGEIISEW